MKKTETELQALRNKYPSVPEYALPKTRNKKKTPAGELQHQIIAYCNAQGIFVQRVNTTGTYNQKLKRFTFSGATKGAADLILTLPGGRTIHVEVKAGKDTQRPAQSKFQASIEAIGGKYIIVKSLEDFISKLTTI